jgi:hypothetical protein
MDDPMPFPDDARAPAEGAAAPQIADPGNHPRDAVPADEPHRRLVSRDQFGRLAGRRLAEVEAEQAIRSAGGIPALLMPHLLAQLDVVQDGDRVRVVGHRAGVPVEPAELMAELRRDPALAAAFPAATPRGGGAVESPRSTLPPGAVSLWDQEAINRHLGDIAIGRIRVVDRR